MTKENMSGLEPLGHAVLVRMVETSEYRGTIEIPDSVRASSAVMEQRCEVVAIGSVAWEDEALFLFGFPIWRRPRAKCGDTVIVTKFAGFVTKGVLDGQLYRLVNDRDIFCRVSKESKDE